MDLYSEFQAFKKIPRLSRPCVITEKLDGTNAQICIDAAGVVRAGSRNRWITPEDDNFGFAAWVARNADELRLLGEGRHYGEWWGKGIQRGYGLAEKRFSLFNTARWTPATVPACCSVVPVLYTGDFTTAAVELTLAQLATGSVAAPGFATPEGVVIFHTASGKLFKKTCENDATPKTLDVAAAAKAKR